MKVSRRVWLLVAEIVICAAIVGFVWAFARAALRAWGGYLAGIS